LAEQSWVYTLAVIALLIVQAVMIATLWLQRTRRRESEARTLAILRAAPDLMFLQTRDGVFLDYYAPERDRLLVAPEQFIGRNMRDVLPPPLVERLVPLFERVGESDQPVIAEYSLAFDGDERWFEARMVPCGDKVLSVVRDISDRTRTAAAQKLTDESLRHAHADLERMSRLVAFGEFATSIAHEVSQPLTAIILNARTCLKWLSDPEPDLAEVRATLSEVIDAGKRADAIITRNRELFRHRIVEKHRLSVNDLMREVEALASSRLRMHRVRLETTIAGDLPEVFADRIELSQLLLNLIANAIDAMQGLEVTSRVVTITAQATREQEVEVSVRDAGAGLAGVDLERMFTTGYSTKPKGTGVGLSICRAIVEAHGGRIRATPNQGSGATFSFTIPVADPQKKHAVPRDTTLKGAEARSKGV